MANRSEDNTFRIQFSTLSSDVMRFMLSEKNNSLETVTFVGATTRRHDEDMTTRDYYTTEPYTTPDYWGNDTELFPILPETTFPPSALIWDSTNLGEYYEIGTIEHT